MRSGVNGTYTPPPGVGDEVAGTPISPTDNNTFVADVAQTFNTPTPEAYGGTGASTYAQARTNLGVPAIADVPYAGYLHGLTMSNNSLDPTNDIDVAAGQAGSSAAPYALMTLAVALTKRLDATWAVGTNQGGLDTGAVANGTYHVFVIRRPDTDVVDVLFSLSATSPTLPANYTQSRRIGSIVRASGAIRPFVQDADTFRWKSGAIDVAATNPGSAAIVRSLTVPTGIHVFAILSVGIAFGASGEAALVSDTDANDEAPTGSLSTIQAGFANGSISSLVNPIRTNLSGQVRTRLAFGGATETLRITTWGYIDSRGKAA